VRLRRRKKISRELIEGMEGVQGRKEKKRKMALLFV